MYKKDFMGNFIYKHWKGIAEEVSLSKVGDKISIHLSGYNSASTYMDLDGIIALRNWLDETIEEIKNVQQKRT